MSFDVNKSLSNISATKTKESEAELILARASMSIPQKLRTISSEVIREFSNTVLTQSFKNAVLSAKETDGDRGVATLMTDAHAYLLEVGRNSIKTNLGELPHEKRIMAEMLLEITLGKAMYSLGATSLPGTIAGRMEGRVLGLDQHPEFPITKRLEIKNRAKPPGEKIGYLDMEKDARLMFGTMLATRAHAGGEWGNNNPISELENLLCGPHSINFFQTLRAKATDTHIWPAGGIGVLLEPYLEKEANNRRQMEKDAQAALEALGAKEPRRQPAKKATIKKDITTAAEGVSGRRTLEGRGSESSEVKGKPHKMK